MFDVLAFAKEILSIPSPTGYSKEVITFLEKEITKRNLTYSKNKKGNLIIEFPGKTDYVTALSAHVDTLGAMVRSVQGDGTLRFSVLGGAQLATYDGEYCTIITREGKKYSGTFLSNAPSSHVYKDAASLPRNDDNMHVRLDEIVKNKNDVEKLGIGTGDFICIDTKTEITSTGFIKSRFLDDKISVAILFALIDYLQANHITPTNTLKFIISTYEELGHGASNIPYADEMIAVDMGCIGQDLNCTEFDVSICVKDSSGPYDFELTNTLIQLAKKEKLNYAVDIYPYYGSDVSAALRGGNDIKGALIGPGVAASHGMERTHKNAVLATLSLLTQYVIK